MMRIHSYEIDCIDKSSRGLRMWTFGKDILSS